jgi:hypothetical protein
MGCKPSFKWYDLPSPAGVLDSRSVMLSARSSTMSQPSSASSLASVLHDAEIQTASRQASESDLGPRPSLSSLGLAEDPAAAPPPEGAAGASPLVDLTSFDLSKLTSLAPIKTKSPPGSARGLGSNGPSPRAPPAAGALASPFLDSHAKGPAQRVPALMHSRAASAGTYNPYDLAAAPADLQSSGPLSRSVSRSALGVGARVCASPAFGPDCVVLIPGRKSCSALGGG